MTVDLNVLADALAADAPEKILERKIAEKREEIKRAIDAGESYVLDADRRIEISRK